MKIVGGRSVLLVSDHHSSMNQIAATRLEPIVFFSDALSGLMLRTLHSAQCVGPARHVLMNMILGVLHLWRLICCLFSSWPLCSSRLALPLCSVRSGTSQLDLGRRATGTSQF